MVIVGIWGNIATPLIFTNDTADLKRAKFGKMSDYKLELKIIKDSKQGDPKLSGMSVDAAKSFVTLLNCLTKIIELSTDSKDVSIEIKTGSLVAVANSSTEQKIIKIQRDYEDVINHKSANIQLVGEWRNIQKLIQSNGLTYDAAFHIKTQKIPIVQQIKTAKPFRAYSKRKKGHTDIIFVTGELIAVGGKKPNIHVLNEKNVRIIADCKRTDAIKANRYPQK